MNDLTPAQTLAYDQLLPFLQGGHSAKLAVLEGFAGTGKTYLVSRLLRDLPGLKIAVAAPTNKAVRVLRDKLRETDVQIVDAGDPDGLETSRARHGCTCRSIHSLLGLKLKEMDNGQHETTSERESTLREYDAVVVDECSMLSPFLFQKIVMERGRAQILFVGDPAQLPPVKEETISPVFAQVNFKVRLVEVVRQARENPIIRLSMRLRDLIEAGVKASALALIEALPEQETGPKAALVREPASTLVAWWLSQAQIDAPGSDVRIIAYTNDRVQWYNQQIHQALYPNAATRFVVGQQVIVHKQCAAQRRVGAGLTESDRLITSEELMVVEVKSRQHPFFPRIAAEWMVLQSETGDQYEVYVACDEMNWQQQISQCFSEFRALKLQAERETDPKVQIELKHAYRDASNQGWALSRSFAPLRHAYAITCHKSQGSTFDCALVDFSDLAKMPDSFQFNRALYVAVTRSREYLALVVT